MRKFSLFMYEHSTNNWPANIRENGDLKNIIGDMYCARTDLLFYRQELALDYQEVQIYHPHVRELAFRRQQTVLSYRLAIIKILKITNDIVVTTIKPEFAKFSKFTCDFVRCLQSRY